MPDAAAVDEIDIIRLNIERYRRLLKTEADQSARLAIEKILKEFEAKLSIAEPRDHRAVRFDLHQR